MISSKHETVQALYRRRMLFFMRKAFEVAFDGKPFDANWHIEAICYQLDQCERGDHTRLSIEMPPRTLKSFCASVAFPLWLLGRNPSAKILCISYGEELGKQFAQVRQKIAESKWYRKLFPNVEFNKCNESQIQTKAGGQILRSSVGGALTGFGADFIIVDDPIKAGDANSKAEREKANDWFRSTLYSRLENKEKGVIIIVAQRTHEDDLIGSVVDNASWIRLVLPAIATEDDSVPLSDEEFYGWKKGEPLHSARESLNSLEETRRVIGSYNFAAQYQQAPIPPQGNLFKRKWFKTYKRAPEFDQIVQSWDTAASAEIHSSYSVCLTWGIADSSYYLMDVFREQVEFPTLQRSVKRNYKNHRADAVLIEGASSGLSLIQNLNGSRLPIIARRPHKDKVTRAEQVSAMVEAGHVYIPQNAPWLEQFLSEILGFPNSKTNDQVDAFTQFLNWVHERGRCNRLETRVYNIGGGSTEIHHQDRYFDRTGIPTFRK